MAQPDLTSHHVNYLIWRYVSIQSPRAPQRALIVSCSPGTSRNQVRSCSSFFFLVVVVSPSNLPTGLAEAAVSLQRAWNPDPQSLPFARHIKTHALVSLVQKGLQYHELESSIDKVCSRDHSAACRSAFCLLRLALRLINTQYLNISLQEGNPATFTPSHYFFGPEPFDLKALQARRDEVSTDQSVDRATNGHPAEKSGKKNRLSETNGDVPMGVDAEIESKGSPIPDQVDGDGDVSMGPDDVPQEPTLTTGTSVGVQISPAKTADLSPNTDRKSVV